MFHYVYRITNIEQRIYYYGKRSSKIEPENDNYMSSSKYLKEDIERIGVDKFTKKIIRKFNSAKEAIEFEILLHNKFDVKNHNKFYNRSNQTSSGFDTTGRKDTEETKKKKSKAKKGYKPSEETKKKIIKTRKRNGNYKQSEETKKKISEKLKGRKPSKESSKQGGITRSGRNNCNAKTIEIYDNEDNLKFVSKDNFKNFCNDNNLPYSRLIESYRNKTKIDFYLNNHSLSRAKKSNQMEYNGWYAKIKD